MVNALEEQFKGVFVALITPFKDGKVDDVAYQSFINWLIDEGVHGIVPCGTTGESPTLSHDEHCHVVELAVEAAAGRVPVMAGAGSNSTAEAIEFTQHAKKAGADAVLAVTPYYNKPTQAGMIAHFEAIANAVEIPNFLYNIPGRSVVDLKDESLAVLAKHQNIVGLKDATGDLARVSTLRHLVSDDFILFSGEDMTTVGFNAMGGRGVISATANVAPSQCAAVQNACLSGDYAKAIQLHAPMVPLHDAMFVETNPIPVKYAAHRLGKCGEEVRLPLTHATAETKTGLEAAMKSVGLI